MKYTINTDSNNKIVALNSWKPLYRNVLDANGGVSGVTTYYEIPENLEEISETVYTSLINRIDLPYITWIESAVVEEDATEKSVREQSIAYNLESVKLNSIKNDLIRLSNFVVLTQEGTDLITNNE